MGLGSLGPIAAELSQGWDAFAQARHAGVEDLQSFRERKCFPATLAWSLLQLPVAAPAVEGRRLVVWVLGARDDMEGWLATEGEWELLAEVFPEARWELVLIGPEMLADVASGSSGQVHIRSARRLGHEFARDEAAADFAVLFNSGIGTLSLPLVRHWLPTVGELLRLDIPVLFTCFGQKERQGEAIMLRQVFQAVVLADFAENPFAPQRGDNPEQRVRKAQMPETLDAIEVDTDVRRCNAIVWWAKGSQLPVEELAAVASERGLRVLEEFAQSFAAKGAYKGWAEALSSGSREVGRLALENFAAALAHPAVAQGLAKISKSITDAIRQHVLRHGQNKLARTCVERLLFAKVKAQLPEDTDAEVLRETVRETVQEQHGTWLGSADADTLT